MTRSWVLFYRTTSSKYVEVEVNTRFQKKMLQATVWKREASAQAENCRKVICRAAVGIHGSAPVSSLTIC